MTCGACSGRARAREHQAQELARRGGLVRGLLVEANVERGLETGTEFDAGQAVERGILVERTVEIEAARGPRPWCRSRTTASSVSSALFRGGARGGPMDVGAVIHVRL